MTLIQVVPFSWLVKHWEQGPLATLPDATEIPFPQFNQYSGKDVPIKPVQTFFLEENNAFSCYYMANHQ